MLYATYKKGDYQVIKFNDVLDMYSTVDELDKIVNEFIKKNIVKIAFHFRDDTYLSSRTGAVFIRIWETLKDHDGDMIFVNINNDIRDFLAIIDFDSSIKVCNSEEELETVNT